MTIKIPSLMFDKVGDTGSAKIDPIDLDGIKDKSVLNDILKDDKEEKEEDEDTDEDEKEEKEGEEDDDADKSERSRERDDEDVDEDKDEDVDEEDEEEEKDEEDDDEDKDKEDKDDEEESEEEDETDELEAASLYQKLKKFDEKLFKKFPRLRDVIHREGQFSDIFATPKEAKFADENSKLLDHLHKSITSGDTAKMVTVLESVQKDSKEGLSNFVHSFLPALGKLSSDLYGDVLKIPLKKALQTMYADGIKNKNKNMYVAAIYAHEFFFDNQDIKSDFENPLKGGAKSKEKEDLDKEREEFNNTKFNDFRSDINEAITHSMKNKITKSLEGVKDASGEELSNYIKMKIIRDISDEIDEMLGSDSRHQNTINSLAKQAKSSGLNKEWKSRIISAYLGRAQSILPTAKLKVLKEAGIKNKIISKEVRRLTPGRPNSGGSIDKINWEKVDYRRTSDMDILNDTPKYKKDK